MKSRSKIRFDQLLQEKHPTYSRSRLQALIMAGKVTVNGIPFDKPGMPVESDSELVIIEPDNPYVSRGGLKLKGAIADMRLDFTGLRVLDAGASTGGFTDCLLQHGAVKVIALDVGYGQLDHKLRKDPRVVVLERFNVRNLRPEDISDSVDFATVDLSFISLKLVLPVFFRLPVPALLALVKPQFEAGRADAGKGRGVIRDPVLHRAVLEEVIFAAVDTGYSFRNLTYSRLPGPKGNLEYFLLLAADPVTDQQLLEAPAEAVSRVVTEAHALLLR
ncbi:MAG: TlyA family RNA methyltransferase [Firmicutes bacterium]|nr:TlyA family RNA methyltransferase [Bacillota bacterium]